MCEERGAVAPLFYFHDMLQLNSSAPNTAVYIPGGENHFTRLSAYPLKITNLATTEVDTTQTAWIANLVHKRYTEALVGNLNFDTGMYLVEFRVREEDVVPYFATLAYASPGGNTAIPQTNYDVDNQATEDIYIYHE